MNPEKNYRQEPYDIEELKTAFNKLQDEMTKGTFDQQNFDLIKFLELESDLRLQETSEMNLQKWSAPIQKYINKRLLAYVQDAKEFHREDLEVIRDFFETGLRDPDTCDEDALPDKNWVDAMNSLAHELRNYYGYQESDGIELPCWRR